VLAPKWLKNKVIEIIIKMLKQYTRDEIKEEEMPKHK